MQLSTNDPHQVRYGMKYLFFIMIQKTNVGLFPHADLFYKKFLIYNN